MRKPDTITGKQIMPLDEKQNFRCALSGRELTPQTASLDHIVPLSRDGSHSLKNLWVVDHMVNNAKGSLTVQEFRAMCRDVSRHADLPHEGVNPEGPPAENEC